MNLRREGTSGARGRVAHERLESVRVVRGLDATALSAHRTALALSRTPAPSRSGWRRAPAARKIRCRIPPPGHNPRPGARETRRGGTVAPLKNTPESCVPWVVPRARLRLGRGGGRAVLIAGRTATIGAHLPYRRGSVEGGHRRTRRGSAARGGIPVASTSLACESKSKSRSKYVTPPWRERRWLTRRRGSSFESPRWRSRRRSAFPGNQPTAGDRLRVRNTSPRRRRPHPPTPAPHLPWKEATPNARARTAVEPPHVTPRERRRSDADTPLHAEGRNLRS